MLPLNPLECRERTSRYGMLSPIQPGISPRNLFELRSKNTRNLQFLKDKGNSPTKLLLCKLNMLISKIINNNIEVGMGVIIESNENLAGNLTLNIHSLHNCSIYKY
jgi:hypothetical protein